MLQNLINQIRELISSATNLKEKISNLETDNAKIKEEKEQAKFE